MPKVSGMYQGTDYIAIDTEYLSGIERADTFFEKVVTTRNEQSIVNIVYVPIMLFDTSDAENPKIVELSAPNYSFLVRPSTVDGYTPKNNKLLTYPYIGLSVNCLSDNKTYRYEWFESGIKFNLKASLNSAPEVACAPIDYNGIVYGFVGQDDNATEQLVMSGFPQCAFTIDSYRAWVANKAQNFGWGMVGTVAGTIGSLVTGNLGGMISGSVSAFQQAHSAYLEATEGNKTKGTQGGNINASTKRMDFYFKNIGITENYARYIDDFFSRFGYSCRRIKIPNRNVRPHWTYTQTKECTIRGRVPVDDMNKICSIYDKGITFWNSGDEVGDYSLNNAPVSGGGT